VAAFLLLFDIDGTLLRDAAREHAEAMYGALHDVYGIPDPPPRPGVRAAGRTDIEIARSILLANGVSALRIDDGLPEFRAATTERYAQLVPDDLSAKVAPGIPELLEALAARDDVLLSLVTGNLEPVARLKLRAAGIGGHFPRGQGGFGSDAEDRALLPEVARRRAGTRGRAHPRERTWVIGDTPRDIACARADGVRVLAVATGPYRPDELSAADAVAADARGLRGVLDAELR